VAEENVPSPVEYQVGRVELALPDVAVVGVKLLGLYSLLLCVPYLTYLPLPWVARGPGGSTWEMGEYALPGACYVAVGLVLLFGAEWVVTRVMGVRGGVVPPLPVSQHFQAMAFSFAGVLFAVDGLAELAAQVANFAEIQSQRSAGNVVEDPQWYFLAHPVVELAAGLVLFLRGRGLAALWHRMRYGGVRVREAE
jgi:hypothetical protein